LLYLFRPIPLAQELSRRWYPKRGIPKLCESSHRYVFGSRVEHSISSRLYFQGLGRHSRVDQRCSDQLFSCPIFASSSLCLAQNCNGTVRIYSYLLRRQWYLRSLPLPCSLVIPRWSLFLSPFVLSLNLTLFLGELMLRASLDAEFWNLNV
jgi:hypothetical protein